eukprot:690586-Pyramimonas_sp.AAC.1
MQFGRLRRFTPPVYVHSGHRAFTLGTQGALLAGQLALPTSHTLRMMAFELARPCFLVRFGFRRSGQWRPPYCSGRRKRSPTSVTFCGFSIAFVGCVAVLIHLSWFVGFFGWRVIGSQFVSRLPDLPPLALLIVLRPSSSSFASALAFDLLPALMGLQSASVLS